jgi:UDP-N-acetylmuramoyl-tripeptide--D-alanyl-D-alanine ligase
LALENFNLADHPKKIIILGDMFELGDSARTEHQSIVNIASQFAFHRCIFVGENFYGTNANEKYVSFAELKSELIQNPINGAFILIKGSRGMALERALEVMD